MFNLSDKVYDFLSKFQRWIPTIGVLYIALGEIWGFPFGDEINKTIAVIATFLASYLEICTVQYQKALNRNAVDIQTTVNEDSMFDLMDGGEIENVQDTDNKAE